MSGGLRNGTVRCRQRPTRYQPERAVLVNYACHAVVLGPNSEISADYPGAMQRFVEQALGSEAIVLFTNGAEGDSNPIIHPGSRDDVNLLGQRLGAEVLKAVDNLELRDVRVLRMSRARVSLPLRRRPSLEQEAADLDRLAEENLKLREGQTSGLIQGEMDHSVIMLRHLRRRKYRQTIDAEISALRIADTVLATIPGELFNELGREVAAAAPSGVTIVLVGLANGHIGYLPTAEAYEEGGFEVEATALAPGAGETLRDHLVALVREVSVP